MRKKGVIIAAVLLVILLGALTYRFVWFGKSEETEPQEEQTSGTMTELPADAVLKTSAQTAYPGDYVAFSVTNAPEAKLSADLDGEELQLSSAVVNGTLIGILGVPLEDITLSTLTIHAGNLSAVVEIHGKQFGTATTEVPSQTDEASSNKDMQNYSDALAKGVKDPQWTELFALPAAGNELVSFGASLTSDGNVVGQNGGVNIEAAEGTDVTASNDGVVVFAGEMSTGGSTVIISHGLGIFSLYQHMSEITANTDASVKKGEVIGKVGKTGYVSTPQLYFSVIVANAPVDPFQLTVQNPLEILK